MYLWYIRYQSKAMIFYFDIREICYNIFCISMETDKLNLNNSNFPCHAFIHLKFQNEKFRLSVCHEKLRIHKILEQFFLMSKQKKKSFRLIYSQYEQSLGLITTVAKKYFQNLQKFYSKQVFLLSTWVQSECVATNT